MACQADNVDEIFSECYINPAITLFPVSGGTSYHTLKHLRDTLQGSSTG